jgi:hypothetical protein
MYIHDFEELLGNVSSLSYDNRIIKLFPDSFQNGLCVRDRDIYFPSILKSGTDIPFTKGLVISSTGKSKYSENKSDYLGLIILDYDLDKNFIVPFYASASDEEIALDSNCGFPTNVSSFDEVPSLLSIISDIDKVQRDSANNLLGRGLEFLQASVGGGCDDGVEMLYGNLDSVLYGVKYDDRK